MSGLWRAAKWSVVGTLGVAVLTFLAFRLHMSFSTASFCFLLFLVLQSLSGDPAASVVVSFLAVGCLDYFFTEPLFSFEVASPFDLLALVSFLSTALVANHGDGTVSVLDIKEPRVVSSFHAGTGIETLAYY